MVKSIMGVTPPFAIEDCWSYAPPANGISNTGTAVTARTAAAGIRSIITGIHLSWNTLGATTEFALRDGAAGTVLFRCLIGTAAGFYIYAPPTPIKGSINTLLEFLTLTGVTGNVYCNLTGYNAA